MKTSLFKLTSENLTGLGGPMGSESTSTNWIKFFTSLANAKAYAERDYGSTIRWMRDGSGLTSGDLLHVMYDIQPVKVES